MKRVVITGLGLITSIGDSVNKTWDNLPRVAAWSFTPFNKTLWFNKAAETDFSFNSDLLHVKFVLIIFKFV